MMIILSLILSQTQVYPCPGRIEWTVQLIGDEPSALWMTVLPLSCLATKWKMLCNYCDPLRTRLNSVFWLSMRTLCYLHRDLLLEFLVQLKKMLWLLIFVVDLGTWNRIKPVSTSRAPPTSTPCAISKTRWPSPMCNWRWSAKSTQNLSSVIGKGIIRRQEVCQVSVMCVSVFKDVVVCAQVVCLTTYLSDEVNAMVPSCPSPLSCPQTETEISDTQGEDWAAWKPAKCIKLACPDYDVKIHFLLIPSYIHKALTMHPVMSEQGSGGRINYFSFVSDGHYLGNSSKQTSNGNQKWVINIF